MPNLPEVPAAILAQLGGNQFCAMVGVSAMVYGERSLMLSIGRGAKNKANKLRVTLTSDDTYNVEFFSVRGINCTNKGEHSGVYADSLRQVIRTATGFDLNL
jgi:hypothetical protein